MMSEQSIRDIERSLERDRLALAQSVAALRERVRPANLISEGKAAVKAKASPLVADLDRTLRSRPVAVAVASLAVAALVAGRRTASREADPAPEAPALAGTRFEALTRWEDEGGPPAPEPVEPDEDWMVEATGLRARAQALLARIDDAARRGLAPAADLARHRAEVLAALAADMRAAFAKGLESLDDAARTEAIAARERIHAVRFGVADKSREAVEGRPLMVGAVVAAAGALVACLLPQTRTENRLFGKARDRLADDVTRMARQEVMQASDLARSLSRAFQSDLSRAAGLFTASRGDERPTRPH